MKIGLYDAVSNYSQSEAVRLSDKTKDKVSQKSKEDTLEISSEGKQALEKSSSGTRGYDLQKVLAIHEKGFHEIPTREESEYYHAARKSDPELDAALYAMDKAEALKVVGQVQTILMKAANGLELSPEEQKMVDEDPALQQEIEVRKSKAQMLKNISANRLV